MIWGILDIIKIMPITKITVQTIASAMQPRLSYPHVRDARHTAPGHPPQRRGRQPYLHGTMPGHVLPGADNPASCARRGAGVRGPGQASGNNGAHHGRSRRRGLAAVRRTSGGTLPYAGPGGLFLPHIRPPAPTLPPVPGKAGAGLRHFRMARGRGWSMPSAV